MGRVQMDGWSGRLDGVWQRGGEGRSWGWGGGGARREGREARRGGKERVGLRDWMADEGMGAEGGWHGRRAQGMGLVEGGTEMGQWRVLGGEVVVVVEVGVFN